MYKLEKNTLQIIDARLFHLVSIIRVGAVFPVIVLVLDALRRRLHIPVQLLCEECHLSHFLENDCVVHRLLRVPPHANGPWFLQSTAGTAMTSLSLKVSMISVPVFFS